MKLIVRQETVRRSLRCIQGVLLAAAIGALAYCAFVVIDARNFQKREALELDRMLIQSPAAAATKPGETIPDDLLGRIEVPRLGVSVMVIEGTSAKTLRRAAGHIAGTGLPGAAGNIGISAHRDSFFRPLRNIRGSDVIALTTRSGEFHYRVVSTRIVDPDDVTVLNPD